MKKILSIIGVILLLSTVAYAQTTGTISQLNPWKVSGTTITPVKNTNSITVPQLGGSGTKCIHVDNTGLFSTATADCGSGGGGSGGGTWSTTTSSVSGRLINYPNNTTDIVNIGSGATTTGKYWFDPNTLRAYLSGNVGIGTTSPYAPLSVVGQIVGSYLTATTTTATSTFNGHVDVVGNLRARGIGNEEIVFGSAGGILDSSNQLTYSSNTLAAPNLYSSGDVYAGSSLTLDYMTTNYIPYIGGGSGTQIVGSAGLQYNPGTQTLSATNADIGELTVNDLVLPGFISQDCLGTDGSGNITTGTCTGGGSSASSTLLVDNNTFSGQNTFSSSTATTTFAGDITFNNAYGVVLPLQDTAANLASVVPQSGQLVYETDTGFTKVGNGTATVSNISPLNTSWLTSGSNTYYNTGNVGIGTTSPYAKLSVAGQVVGSYFTATSTTATSTFSSGVSIANALYVRGKTLVGQAAGGSDIFAANEVLRVVGGNGGTDTELGFSGGGMSFTGGVGGSFDDAYVSNPSTGGKGGTLNLTAGTGGYVEAINEDYDHVGGNGGDLLFAAGNGGRTVGGNESTAGNGGNIILSPGLAGVASGANVNTNGSPGKVGIATSSPWRTLSVNGSSDLGTNALAGYFTGTTTATSTLAGGLNITSGCLAVSGTCITGGGSGTNYWTNSGATTTLNTGTQAAAGTFLATNTTDTSIFSGFLAVNPYGGIANWASFRVLNNTDIYTPLAGASKTFSTVSMMPTMDLTGVTGTTSVTGVLIEPISVVLPNVSSTTLFSSLAVKSTDNAVMNIGSQSLFTSATVYIEGKMTQFGSFTTQPNYALLVDDGMSRFDSQVLIGTSSQSSTQPMLRIQASGSTIPTLDIASSTGSSVFTISKNDNLGIGSSTPFAKLSVAGNIIATGSATSSIGHPLQVGTTSPSSNSTTTSTLYVEGRANNYNLPSAGILQINSLGDADSPGISNFNRNRGLFFGIDTNTTYNAGAGFIQYYRGTQSNVAGNLALNPNGGGVVLNGIFGETSTSFPVSIVGNSSANALVKIQNISTNGGSLATPYAGIVFQTYNTTNTYEKGGIVYEDKEGGSCCYLRGQMKFLLNPTASNANVQDTVAASTIMTLGYKNGYGSGSNLTNPVVGIGTTTPFAKLSVHLNNGETNYYAFAIASSTASATSTHFVVQANGNVGIGTTTPQVSLAVEGLIQTNEYTVATLPACTALTRGSRAHVTDALAPTFLAALTGGGAVVAPAFCNGTTWVAD